MIANPLELDTLSDSDRMLLVAARGTDRELAAMLRRSYPAWVIRSSDDYLSAIAELCGRKVDVVLAWVDAALPQMANAVAGLREAAGPKARLVLCCRPDTEPLAQRILNCGADDYVLVPLEEPELDSAIGYIRSNVPRVIPVADSGLSERVWVALVRAVSALGGRPRELLQSLAELACDSVNARGAMLVAEGAMVASGEDAAPPVLTVPIVCDNRGLGSIQIGPRREGAYGPEETARLSHIAMLAARLLEVALRNRRWQRLAVTDDCTGLPNRRFLQERMRTILQQAAAACLPVTLLLFDIDNFKAYNDEYGHDAGDEVLRLTGDLFRKHCREQDLVTRYGGDEFVVVFWDSEGPRIPGSKHPDCALAVLRRFREALKAQRFTKLPPDSDARLTISGGLATYPWAAHSLPDLLARADDALRAAKRAGRNQVLVVGANPTIPQDSSGESSVPGLG